MGQLMEMGSNLRESGLSAASLAIVATLFLLTIILSARELLAWYLKLNRIQDQLETLTEAVQRIEKRMANSASDGEAAEIKTLALKAHPPERQAFPLNH